jgi:protein-tyrosine phosphatase
LAQFWAQWRETGLWCTPLYYGPHLKRFPEKTATVVRAVANAKPGGILIHCGAGRDRTGLISLVILHLSGVASEDISVDHSLSHDNLSRRHKAHGGNDDRVFIEMTMAKLKLTTLDVVHQIFQSINLESLLLESVCTTIDINAVKAKLIDQ